MTSRLSRWSVLVTLASALALSACAGGVGPSVPGAPGFSQAAFVGSHGGYQPRDQSPDAQPNLSCPKRYFACWTVSKSKGLDLIWCYGPSSDPCGDSDAGKAKWSGVVCDAKGATCKGAIKVLTAKWSGPFKCQAKDKCEGTYELDKITPHAGLKETSKIAYKQDIHVCVKGGSCENVYDGFNVGK
jgi:hypothetical protein